MRDSCGTFDLTICYNIKGRGRMEQLALRRLEQKLTKENLWIYILHLLRGGPLYAYEIRDKIRAAFGFEPATITVYVVLYKMEREGLVTSATEKRAPSNMVRRYYSLTEAGLRALEEGGKMLRRTLDLLEVSERSATS